MSYYLIVEKETNIVQALLEIDGDYFIDSTYRYSLKITSKPEFDFYAFVYTIDKDTGKVSKIPRVSEEPLGLIKSLEITIE